VVTAPPSTLVNVIVVVVPTAVPVLQETVTRRCCESVTAVESTPKAPLLNVVVTGVWKRLPTTVSCLVVPATTESGLMEVNVGRFKIASRFVPVAICPSALVNVMVRLPTVAVTPTLMYTWYDVDETNAEDNTDTDDPEKVIVAPGWNPVPLNVSNLDITPCPATYVPVSVGLGFAVFTVKVAELETILPLLRVTNLVPADNNRDEEIVPLVWLGPT
jgi:hypothetical protein